MPLNNFTLNAKPEFIRVIAELRSAHEVSSPSGENSARERSHVREAALTLLRVSLDLLAQARPEREIDGLTNELIDSVLSELGAYSTELEEKWSKNNESK